MNGANTFHELRIFATDDDRENCVCFFFRFHYRLRPAIIVVIATRKRTRQRLTQLTHSDDCKLTVFSQQTPETCFLILEQNQIKFVLDLTCVELTFVHVTSDY